jgi:CO/xanthine dehydrogenase Mo-binding subunit
MSSRNCREHDQPASKIGARGVGEVGEVGVAAAIANALARGGASVPPFP